MSQKGRIIKLLKERGKMGAFVYEIITPRPQGLGIAQYNARIKELRETGYNIRNVKPGHFVLEENRLLEVENIFTKPRTNPRIRLSTLWEGRPKGDDEASWPKQD